MTTQSEVSTPWRRPRIVPTPNSQRTKCPNNGYAHHWDISAEPTHAEQGWVFVAVCRHCGGTTTYPYKYTPGNSPAEESAVNRLREPTYKEMVQAVLRRQDGL